ncbi:MAG: LLM class F420-dependent oxidoreductase [Alphaproteobacteria bacterium]|nr:LLM class F420-dependent oxidoreductase [Alphaproteobacteria bacterium]
MRIGVIFPQIEYSTDAGAVRDYGLAAEALGYKHILAYDHVVGALRGSPSRPEWSGPYDHTHPFHEPFVLFGYWAGMTSRIEFATGVVILAQRQAVLVAKQAAALDVLSRGRLRLGVGIGWNAVEYEALGQNFKNRGKRSEEQVTLMRRLWTEELVTFEGKYHKIVDAGLNPLPIQRPIPVWFGGNAEALIERVGRMGDGWLPIRELPGDNFAAMLGRMRDYAKKAGRDPKSIGIESWVSIVNRPVEEALKDIEKWRGLGATHISLQTMSGGFTKPDQHIAAIRRFADAAPELFR